MALTISEEQISTTNLLNFVSFILLKRGTTVGGTEVFSVAVLPAFYGRDAAAKVTPHEQLFIEVEESSDNAAAIARVRLALTNRFAEMGHPRKI